MGVCAGCQMLETEINDPLHTESNLDSIRGLGLLNMVTIFESKKITIWIKARMHDVEGQYF